MELSAFLKRYTYNPKLDIIGNGGFGKVYKAYDDYRDRYVAIKVSEVKSFDQKFTLENEVRLNKTLEVHKNIAYYEDCFRFELSNGTFDYGILQFYEEGSLANIIKKNKLELSQKTQIAEGIIQGLLFLRKNKILHRDLKSENILISKKNDEYIPKITDFGLSKELGDEEFSYFENSFIGGSIKYSAPEQLLNGKVKENADIWSLGVILYELFSGKLPIDFETSMSDNPTISIENVRRITEGELNIDYDSIPSPYDDLIKGCLVVNPNERLRSVEDLNVVSIRPDKITIETFVEEKRKSKIEKIIADNDKSTKNKGVNLQLNALLKIKQLRFAVTGIFTTCAIILMGFSSSNYNITKKPSSLGYGFNIYDKDHQINKRDFENVEIPLWGNIIAKTADSTFLLNKDGNIIEVKTEIVPVNTEIDTIKKTKPVLENRIHNKKMIGDSIQPSAQSNKDTEFSSTARRQTIIMGNEKSSPIIINPPQKKSKSNKSRGKTRLVGGNLIIEN